MSNNKEGDQAAAEGASSMGEEIIDDAPLRREISTIVDELPGNQQGGGGLSAGKSAQSWTSWTPEDW